ncbi:hypothetical protein [Undibacterium terreum]|nr:hypothetical protein [Undibacterium terreum]
MTNTIKSISVHGNASVKLRPSQDLPAAKQQVLIAATMSMWSPAAQAQA